MRRRRPEFRPMIASDGKPYWILVAANGKTLCASETFESRAMCEKGIRAARWASAMARVKRS